MTADTNLLLDPGAHPVIGHRGAAAYAPENTVESFRLALRLGAEALEFDIRRSADGEAMVFHDPTLERTTDRAGPLAQCSADELRGVDAGFRFVDADGATSYRGKGIRIPLLKEVLREFREVPLLIEIKEREVQAEVARVLRDSGASSRAVVAGNDWQALQVFREPPFSLGASRRDIARLYLRIGHPDERCRCYAVPQAFHGLPIPTPRFVRAAGARRSTVHVWTVDDAGSALALWLNGVHGIVTNRPDVIRVARSTLGS